MAELTAFERRLADALLDYADEVPAAVDAAIVAHRVALEHPRSRATVLPGRLAVAVSRVTGRRRDPSLVSVGHPLPVPIWVVVALGLLLAALVGSVVLVGSPWNPWNSLVLLNAPTATPTPTTSPSPTPTASPAPSMTDGQGDEYVVGTETVEVTTPYEETKVGDVTQYRGGVITNVVTLNDPRVSGQGTYPFSVDAYGVVGTEWGTYRLENADGAWEGTCTSGAWNGGDAVTGACWLVGSGAYQGYTFYKSYTWLPGAVTVQGVIYPGSPPAP